MTAEFCISREARLAIASSESESETGSPIFSSVPSQPNSRRNAIDNAHFARDGTFAAAVTIEGKTVQETGTYNYNGLWLTMRPKGGGQRRYNTVLKGRTFELHDGERKVFLRKGKKNARK